MKRETVLQLITQLRQLPKGEGPGQLPVDIESELGRLQTALEEKRITTKAAEIFVEQLSANIPPPRQFSASSAP